MLAAEVVTGVDVLALVAAIGLMVGRGWLAPAAGLLIVDAETAERAFRRLTTGFLALLWLTSLAWLWTRTADMSGQSYPDALPMMPVVLFQTHFGLVWWLRLAALLWCSAVWFAFLGRGARPAWLYVGLLLFGLAWIAASRSAAGHAAADGDWTPREAMDWLHLVSISVWGGGLIVTTLIVFPRLGDSAPAGRARFARRFSRLSGLALAGVLAGGIYNSLQMMPAVSAFWTTPYGQLLGIKLLVVAAMIVCGAINRYLWVPALEVDSGADGDAAVSRFRAVVLAEALFLLGVLSVTAMLLQTMPPH